jgi:NHL repeat
MIVFSERVTKAVSLVITVLMAIEVGVPQELARANPFLSNPIGIIATVVPPVMIVLIVMAANASPALAETHPPVSSFGRTPSEVFSNPNGIAVDESTGDVYVADLGGGTVSQSVSKFDASGTPVNFTCGAPCSAYVTGNEITGTPTGPFAFPNERGTPASIAVDNSTSASDPSKGDLYVLDAGHEAIDKFAPSGQYIGQITGFTSPPLGLGVDPSGDVRVDVKSTESTDLAIDVFDDAAVNGFTTLISKVPRGAQLIGTQEYYGFATAGQPGGDYPLLSPCKCAARLGPNGEQYGRVDDGTTAVAVAVDPADGHVYVDDQSALEHSVREWDTGEMNGTPRLANSETEPKSTGTFVAEVGSLLLTGSTEHPEQGGMAVDGATGDLYVSNPADGRVYVFGSNAPTTVVEAATNVTKTSATLHGTVNPQGVLVTECRVEYDTAGGSSDLTRSLAVLDHSVPCLTERGEPIGEGTFPVAVHADIGVPPQAPLRPGSLYHFRIVASNANGETHSGGLFPTASAGFGFKQFDVSFLNRDGTPDVQAGSHPYKMVTTVVFNTQVVPSRPTELLYSALPAGNAKDITLHLPPGFYGDPNATAKKCTLQQLVPGGLEDSCPPESELGTLEAEFVEEPEPYGPVIEGKKLVNVEPPPGVAFQMAAKILAPNAFIDAGVPAGGDSGVTAVLEGIPVTVPVFRGITTIFGVPPLNPRGPLLTMPTSCNGPLTTTIRGDSYQEAGHFATATSTAPGMGGCAQLEFHPTLEVKPDSPNASSASGLDVHVRVPQKAALNPTGLAESTLRDTTVALPPGVAINPSGGGGLEGCSEGLAGVTGSAEFNPGPEPGDRTITFTPTPLEQLQPGVSFCPDTSKVGTAKVKTPLLENPLEGAVYVAAQNQNPFGSLIAMYMMIEDPISGSTIKIPFKVQLCQSQGEVIGGLSCKAPGQIVTTAHNTPELPFEDLELHFFGGERAPLTTPSRCGTYTTEALLTPWDGTGPVETTSSFKIEHGPHGGPCPGARLPFDATFTGGSTNLQAGSFTPLTGTFSREDGEQQMKRVHFALPPGLSGILTGVELCPEAQANAGTCGPDSLIGETTVSAGVGSEPVSVEGGKVYLTEKYHGSPFGLSVVDPVKAGPFDLEHDTANPNQNPACDCIVVRAKIDINPLTSALTITSNAENEGFAIPQFIDGIPVQIKKINFTTTRSGFQFNPTNCAKMAIAGSVESDEGESHAVEVPFQVTNCAALKFEPKFSVSTSGRTSKANGASLTAKVTYPNVPQGTDADIAKVKVELPKQLPSRLTTLQKACTAKQFDANPAGCPPESKIGYAVVHTPILPVPLEGPAIFVSHGGEAFPSLTMVLQGDNVTIDLVGTTFISKAGITSTDFKTVPDQPFSTFELTLPQGRYSALTANANLCSSTRTVLVKRKVTVRVKGRKKKVTRKVRQTVPAALTMPTEFVAQNGATIHETTKIAVTGCAKTVKKKAKKKASSHHHGKGKAKKKG